MITFNINPIGKPRMTQRDKWHRRKVTDKYWAYKAELNLQAKKLNFVISERLEIVFYLEMPSSWSKKKKAQMNGKPHQQKPDVDNILKGFLDCLTDDDSFIWDISVIKVWSETGKIEIKL